MKNYTVYFEIFGKKMKTTITADNEIQARVDIRSKIIFHKVVETPPTDNEIIDSLFNGFKM